MLTHSLACRAENLYPERVPTPAPGQQEQFVDRIGLHSNQLSAPFPLKKSVFESGSVRAARLAEPMMVLEVRAVLSWAG